MSTRQSPSASVGPSLYVAMVFLTVHVWTAGFFVLDVGSDVPSAGQAQAAEASKPLNNEPKPEGLRKFTGALPPAVVDMREAILAAADMGDIGELKHAIELNELKPDFGEDAKGDPIAFWKKVSADGEGREVLAALATLLALPPARVALGQNPENTAAFVWPYLAELPPETLRPGELVDAYRLVSPQALEAMTASKRWSHWRLAISADGTWISFRR